MSLLNSLDYRQIRTAISSRHILDSHGTGHHHHREAVQGDGTPRPCAGYPDDGRGRLRAD